MKEGAKRFKCREERRANQLNEDFKLNIEQNHLPQPEKTEAKKLGKP